MRWSVILFALCACEPLPEGLDGRTTTSGATAATCAMGEDWTPAVAASVQITTMQIDGANYSPGFNPDGVYPSMGPAACFNIEESAHMWMLEVAGEEWATLYMATSGEVGLLDVSDNSTGDRFLLDVLDPYLPVSFGNTDFFLGTWQTLELEPFEFSITGSATTYFGETANMTLSASMTTE